MGTTLEHGVYLPDEGERNCYAGLKVNWETLDQKVADISALQSAIAGALHREIVATLPTTDIDPNTIYMILSGTSATENVYNEFMYVNNAWELIGTSATDLTNYYTKGEIDSKLLLKASASDLTSHTGDTTIHVTASDKAKWNTVALIKQLRLVNTQVGSATTIAFANIDDTNGIKVGDKCMDLDGKMFEITAVDTTNQTVTVGSALIDLALDAGVMHLTGDETCTGNKGFVDNIIVKKIVSNVAQLQINARSNSDSVALIAGGSATDGGGIWLYGKNSANNSHVALQVYDTNNSTFHAVRLNMDGSLTPTVSNNGLGSSSYKWVSFNGLKPSALGMPDLSNGVDISSYITDLTGASNTNKYTPTVNGWISIGLSNADFIEIYIPSSLMGGTFTKSTVNNYAQAFMPVIANKEVRITLKGSSIGWAKFYPCQGNV